MKVQNGVNPDFADFDEIDMDAEYAIAEFDNGAITLDELKALVGSETAQAIAERRDGEEFYRLFDAPEDF